MCFSKLYQQQNILNGVDILDWEAKTVILNFQTTRLLHTLSFPGDILDPNLWHTPHHSLPWSLIRKHVFGMVNRSLKKLARAKIFRFICLPLQLLMFKFYFVQHSPGKVGKKLGS